VRLLFAAIAACGPLATPSDTDRPGPDTDALRPPALTVSPDPPRAWGELHCVASDGSEVVWSVGQEEVAGAVLSADRVRAGARLTCRSGATTREVEVPRPNVVLLVTDDLGWGDVGFQGGPVPTPHLDALAAEGTRFDAGYASAPSCSPSRAGMLTGTQQNRFGFEYNLGSPTLQDHPNRGLPDGAQTLPELLRDAGYATALIGKWHLGTSPERHPLARGFDRFFGFLNGQRMSQPEGTPGALDVALSELERESWPADVGGYTLQDQDMDAVLDARHLHDRLTDEATDWIAAQPEGQPFFLMLSWLAPHVPLQVTAEQRARVTPRPDDPAREAYEALIVAIDDGVGAVLDALEARGAGDDTLVVFTSDNGCPVDLGFCSNGPLEGGKLRLTEGGIRVPYVMRWPGRIPADTVDHRAIIHLDLLPTFASAAAAPADTEGLDGRDLLPWLITDAPGEPHPLMFWRTAPVAVVREGPLKLVTYGARTWLWDVDLDPGETEDLSAAQPDAVRRLRGLLRARELLYYRDPTWPPQRADGDYYGTPADLFY
jgi:arylsulfatase A-like enzyme